MQGTKQYACFPILNMLSPLSLLSYIPLFIHYGWMLPFATLDPPVYYFLRHPLPPSTITFTTSITFRQRSGEQ